jgi:hypothetical protein
MKEKMFDAIASARGAVRNLCYSTETGEILEIGSESFWKR